MHLFLQLVLITYVNSTVSLIIPHICKKNMLLVVIFFTENIIDEKSFFLFSYENFQIKSANSTHK